MPICNYCKHENPDGRAFCENCGAILKADMPATPQSPVLPVQTPVVPPVMSQTNIPQSPNTLPQQNIPQQGIPQQPYGQPLPNGQQVPYCAQEGPNSQKFEPANTVPFNAKDQQAYAEKLNSPYKEDYENVSVLAFILGWVSFFFNPLLLTSLAAIILGIIGHVNQGSKKKLAKIGWILGVIALFIHLTLKVLAWLAIIAVARWFLLVLL